MADVTVVSCVYGDGFEAFIPRWAEAIDRLENPPVDVIIGSGSCEWTHPQAFHLTQALAQATTEWIWVVDIDDLAMPDALNGIEAVNADVWMMGYLRLPDELLYLPPLMSNDQILSSHHNQLVGGSAFRRDAFDEVGGFPDVAFQDWALWRRMARHGMRFQMSDRAHFYYNRHSATRSSVEFTYDLRRAQLAELVAHAA